MKFLTNTSLALAIIFLFNIHSTVAQTSSPITIKLGKSTPAYTLDNKKNYEMSPQQLYEDSKIYIYSKEGDYSVTEYELFYLVKEGDQDIAGPFKISGTDITTALAKNRIQLVRGSRLFIDELKAICNDCSQNKNVEGLAFMIKMQ